MKRARKSKSEPDGGLPDISRFTAPYQKRLRGLYAKWLDPEENALKESELKELMRAGMVKDESATVRKEVTEVPPYCSQGRAAEVLTELYNAPVTKMQVHRALQNEGMPGLQKNQSLKMSLVIPWWEANKVLKATNADLFSKAQAAELRKKIDDAERARIEREELERQTNGKWILKADHDASLRRSGALVWGRFCAIIEKDLPRGLNEKLRALNATPELMTEIMNDVNARHRAAVDALQREFSEHAN